MLEFPALSDDEITTVLGKGGALRLKYFIEAVTSSGLLCAWGDDEDTSVMEDEDGVTGIPVWSHPVFAEREFRPNAEPGEGPVVVELDRFLNVWLPGIEEEGDGVAIFPVGGKIAVTLTPDQFKSKITAAQRGQSRSRGVG